MQRFWKVTVVIISLMAALFIFSAMSFAQGSSPLKITKITVTPSPFKNDDTLNFSVEVENPTSAATYADFGIWFYVNEDGMSKYIGTTNSAKLNAGEKRIVNIAQTYKVAKSFHKICFVFTPIDAPNEFGTEFQSCYTASCTYNPSFVRPMLRVPITPQMMVPIAPQKKR